MCCFKVCILFVILLESCLFANGKVVERGIAPKESQISHAIKLIEANSEDKEKSYVRLAMLDSPDSHIEYDQFSRMGHPYSIFQSGRNSSVEFGLTRFTSPDAWIVATVRDPNRVSGATVIQNSLEFGRRWRDRFIYIGSIGILQDIFKSDSLKSIRYKLGIAVPYSISNPVTYFSETAYIPVLTIPRLNTNAIQLSGKHFRISGTHIPPYVILNKDSSVTGSHHTMLKYASVKFNFTVDWNVKFGRGIGVKTENGTPTGVMADVYYGRADLAANTAFTLDRTEFLDFTDAFFEDSVTYVTSRRKSELNWASIISSFDLVIWLLLLLTFLVFVVIYYVLYPNNISKKLQAFNSCFIPYALLLGQGASTPKILSLISLIWIFFGIFITAGYNCNLASFLSVPSAETIPTNFPELSRRTDYKVNFHYIGGSAYAFLKDSKSKSTSLLYRRLNELLKDPINCTIKAILEPKTACIGWNLLLANTVASNLTLRLGYEPLFVSKHALFSISVAFGFEKGYPYTSDFNRIVSMYKDMDLIRKWNFETINSYKSSGIKWLTSQKGNIYNLLKADMEDEPVDYFQMQNLLIIFFFHFSVLCLSSIVFLFEVMLGRRNRSM